MVKARLILPIFPLNYLAWLTSSSQEADRFIHEFPGATRVVNRLPKEVCGIKWNATVLAALTGVRQ